jgi:hypothetical protein
VVVEFQKSFRYLEIEKSLMHALIKLEYKR